MCNSKRRALLNNPNILLFGFNVTALYMSGLTGYLLADGVTDLSMVFYTFEKSVAKTTTITKQTNTF